MNDVLRIAADENTEANQKLKKWRENFKKENNRRYDSHLYSESKDSAMNVPEVKPVYNADAKVLDGREVLKCIF